MWNKIKMIAWNVTWAAAVVVLFLLAWINTVLFMMY